MVMENFSENARGLMVNANTLANETDSEKISTEHILLSMMKLTDCRGFSVLCQFEIGYRDILSEVKKFVSFGPYMKYRSDISLSDSSKKVIEYACEKSKLFENEKVGTENILLGLLNDEGCVAAKCLMNLGLNIVALKESMESNLSSNLSLDHCGGVSRYYKVDQKRVGDFVDACRCISVQLSSMSDEQIEMLIKSIAPLSGRVKKRVVERFPHMNDTKCEELAILLI